MEQVVAGMISYLCQPVGLPTAYQTGELGAAVPAGAPQVSQHHPALAFTAPGILKTLEYAADVFVPLAVAIAGRACETDLLGCVQKLLQLRNAAQLGLVHIDH